jgi:hypothetical protein
MSRVPEGFITLQEAFQALIKRLPFRDFPAQLEVDNTNLDCPERKHNDALYESLFAFLSIKIGSEIDGLEVFYWQEDRSQPDRVLPEKWRKSWWPERNFISGQSKVPISDPMANYNGHILITKRDPFEAWLNSMSRERETHIQATSGAEAKCRAWLETELKTNNPKVKTKKAFYEEAKGKFQSLSQRGFTRAWGSVTVSHPKWRAAGAKKKS